MFCIRRSTQPLDNPPTLHLELIFIIINYVARQGNTTATLKSLSLVSVAFHIHAKKHLLRSIQFRLDENFKQKSKHFLKTFGSSDTTLVRNIRSLKVVVSFPPISATPTRSKILAHKLSKYRRRLIKVITRGALGKDVRHTAYFLLATAPLESLTVISPPELPAYDNTWILHRPLACFSTLNKLHLQNMINIDYPAIILAVYESIISELVLINVTFSPLPAPISQPWNKTVRFSTLEVLDLRHVPLQQILPAIDCISMPTSLSFPCLYELRMLLPAEHADDMWEFLMKGVHLNLERLHLWITGPVDVGTFGNFDLSELPALISISLSSHASLSVLETFGRVAEIYYFLRTITQPTLIEEVSITLSVVIQDPFDLTVWIALYSPHWMQIDDFLASNLFPHLREIKFVLKLVYIHPSQPMIEHSSELPVSIFREAERDPFVTLHTSVDVVTGEQSSLSSFWEKEYLSL